MIGRRRCCCGSDSNCYCSGTLLGFQVALDGLADTFVTGLAADVNGTHILTGTNFLDPFFDNYPANSYCRGRKELARETLDVEVVGPFYGTCSPTCTRTSSDAGNFWRLIARIWQHDDPLTKLRLEVYLAVYGWLTVCQYSVTFKNPCADVWHWEAIIDVASCSSILEVLPLKRSGRWQSPYSGGTYLDPQATHVFHSPAPCPNLSLDHTGATCELSLVT